MTLVTHLQSSQVKHTPKIQLINLYYSKSMISCRFQIHLYIPACAMSTEFTCRVFMKIFLPARFSWIWCKCLWSNFVHSKIFQSHRMQRRFLKNSLLRSHSLLKQFSEKKNWSKMQKTVRSKGIIKNIYKCWNNYYLLIKNYNDMYDCVKIPKNICKVHKLPGGGGRGLPYETDGDARRLS